MSQGRCSEERTRLSSSIIDPHAQEVNAFVSLLLASPDAEVCQSVLAPVIRSFSTAESLGSPSHSRSPDSQQSVGYSQESDSGVSSPVSTFAHWTSPELVVSWIGALKRQEGADAGFSCDSVATWTSTPQYVAVVDNCWKTTTYPKDVVAAGFTLFAKFCCAHPDKEALLDRCTTVSTNSILQTCITIAATMRDGEHQPIARTHDVNGNLLCGPDTLKLVLETLRYDLRCVTAVQYINLFFTYSKAMYTGGSVLYDVAHQLLVATIATAPPGAMPSQMAAGCLVIAVREVLQVDLSEYQGPFQAGIKGACDAVELAHARYCQLLHDSQTQ